MKLNLVEVVGAFYDVHGIGVGGTVAVAFSGGADSVALLAATLAAGRGAVALHCNFHLRGDESDRDERFARSVAAKLGCGIRVRHFDVGARCSATGESVEMACRALRYEWFEHEFEDASGSWLCVAVAHHADDNIETFFLNLLRGTGVRGLCGMPSARGVFLRPMLDVPRESIMDFLSENGLGYVVDSTNLSNDYRRNVLRNEVLPVMKGHFPSMAKAVSLTMANVHRDQGLLDALIDDAASRIVDNDGSIDLRMLSGRAFAPVLLYHLLNRVSGCTYGLRCAEDILRSIYKSGLVFYPEAGDRAFLLDRGKLRLVKADALVHGIGRSCDGEVYPVVWDGECGLCGGLPVPLRIEIIGYESFHPERDASTVWLDADRLAASGSPLLLRRWRTADRIEPFGMKGSKLVSDILSEAKVSLIDKGNVWLLECGGLVLWVLGLRASRHFIVSDSTRRVLKISIPYTGNEKG